MVSLYIVCLIPIFIGAGIYYFNKNVNIWEWSIGSITALLVASGVHFFSYKSQIGDYEIWSGLVAQARQYSAWQEHYLEAVYRTETYTTGSGKNRTIHTRRVFSHYASRTRWHNEYFTIETNINTTHSISKEQFLIYDKRFQSTKQVKGIRKTGEHNSRMIGGDPYDYIASANSYEEPIHVSVNFDNRLKAARSVFNFAPISIEIEKKLYSYPHVDNIFQSNRVLGKAKNVINNKEWDVLCSRLGVAKKVNLIIVGFDGEDSMMGEWQRSLWLGGKKNDLVLCYGDNWAKVFGWSDSDILKKELEQILMAHEINGDILPLIEAAIMNGYQKTDWNKFDHLRIEPTTSHWMWFFGIMFFTQFGLYIFFHLNEWQK